MGILDRLGGLAGGLIIKGAKLVAGAVLERLLGDKKDDGAVERVVRITVDAAVAAATLEAANHLAAPELGRRMRELAQQLEQDFAKAFSPAPHGHAGPMEVEILAPNTEGPMRTLEQELDAAVAERQALDERINKGGQ